MKEIIRITFALTLSCLIAAGIMGATFTVTDHAKKQNEHRSVQETMLGLLGYSQAQPAPKDLAFHSVYRYILEEQGNQSMGYLVPVAGDAKGAYALVILNVSGAFEKLIPVGLSLEASGEAQEREAALKKALPPSLRATYAETTIVASRGRERVAYLLPGEFPGFKTFISVMLALDRSFSVLGLEIMEHEEDPGLGGEITQPYFLNQFDDKTLDRLRDLKVVKDPLPEEYLRALDPKKARTAGLSKEQVEATREKYRGQDIYAITGATISSRAVTDGVRTMVKRFAYRIKVLDTVLAENKVSVTF